METEIISWKGGPLKELPRISLDVSVHYSSDDDDDDYMKIWTYDLIISKVNLGKNQNFNNKILYIYIYIYIYIFHKIWINNKLTLWTISISGILYLNLQKKKKKRDSTFNQHSVVYLFLNLWNI